MAMKTRSPQKRPPSTKPPSSVPAKASAASRRRNPKNGKYPDIRRDLERQREAILNETGEILTHRGDIEAFPDVSDQASVEVDQNFASSARRSKNRKNKLEAEFFLPLGSEMQRYFSDQMDGRNAIAFPIGVRFIFECVPALRPLRFAKES
jgi:hypothetical protein